MYKTDMTGLRDEQMRLMIDWVTEINKEDNDSLMSFVKS